MKANDKQEWDDVSPKNMRESKRTCKVYDIESLRDYYNKDFVLGGNFYSKHSFEPETDYDKRGYFKDFDWKPNIYRLTEKHTPE